MLKAFGNGTAFLHTLRRNPKRAFVMLAFTADVDFDAIDEATQARKCWNESCDDGAQMVVRDYMNPHLLYLRAGNRVEIALRPILDFGLTAVPVLDDDHRPVGIVSLRDLAEEPETRHRQTERLHTIAATETLESAARLLAEHDVHHLVVVESSGQAVGMLSSLDVVRALAGLPPKHPATTASFAIGDEDEVDR